MKANLQRTDLTLPVPAGTGAGLYRTSGPARTHAVYDVRGIIDTVQIPHGHFQTLSPNKQTVRPSAPPSGKGSYIDLWA